MASERFNPRAPRGARPRNVAWSTRPEQFQSTRPTRSATSKNRGRCSLGSFNPRAPRGARLMYCRLESHCLVSIHAPHAERDVRIPALGHLTKVSIHAPHAERDAIAFGARHIRDRFNPRAPRGARPCTTAGGTSFTLFQSTRPTRSATCSPDPLEAAVRVSIHAPHAERDLRAGALRCLLAVSIHAPHAERD